MRSKSCNFLMEREISSNLYCSVNTERIFFFFFLTEFFTGTTNNSSFYADSFNDNKSLRRTWTNEIERFVNRDIFTIINMAVSAEGVADVRPRIYIVTFRSAIIKYYYTLFCGKPYSPTRSFRQSLKHNQVVSRIDVLTVCVHPCTLLSRPLYWNHLHKCYSAQRIYSLIFAKRH